MSTDTATKVPQLHATTAELADKLKGLMTIDHKAGTIAIDQDAYEKLLPADIPLSTAKALHAHEGHLFAAAFEAVGDLSRETAHKHNALTATSATLQLVGKNSFDINWNRSVERNAGLPQNGQPAPKKTVYGTMTGKLTVAGADATIGELGKVAKRQKAAALELFGTTTA